MFPLFVSVFAIAHVAIAQNPPVPVPVPRQSAEPAKQEPPAKLQGRVTNAATGEPLKRANIMLMATEPRPDYTPYSTSTDAAGNFAMAEIVPGKYRLWADRTGYVRQEYGARGATTVGATLTIAPGQELSKVEFRLQPHAVVTGRITDEEGEPIAHVQVQTMSYRYMQGKRQLMPSGNSNTNDLGEYRIFGLPPGRYFLSATLRNQGMMSNIVDRTAGARANEPELGYAPTYYPGTNDPRSAVLIQVAAGKPLTNMDVRLVRTATVRIRGRVTNASPSPMARPMIMLIPRDSGFMLFDRNMSTTRSPDGKFELRGVTPGSYYLTAQIHNGTENQSVRVPVDVGSADIEGLELAVSPGQEVTGTVRIEGQTPVNPSMVRIFLEPKDPTPMMGGGSPGVVKEDGTFSLRNVMPDTYRVRVMGAQNQVYVKSVYAGQQEAKDGEVTVVAGAPPTLAIVASTAGGQIAGTVKGEKDAPWPGAAVILAPDTAKRHRQDLFKFATTDQYGKFSLPSLAPGDYKLFAWDSVEMGQWMDPDFLKPYENKGKSITIKENAKETADMELLKNEGAGNQP